MTTQTPTAPASEAGKCVCDPNRELPQSPLKCCEKYIKGVGPFPEITALLLQGTCFKCGHDEACHTTNRAEP